MLGYVVKLWSSADSLHKRIFGDQHAMFQSLSKVWMQARVTLCDYSFKDVA